MSLGLKFRCSRLRAVLIMLPSLVLLPADVRAESREVSGSDVMTRIRQDYDPRGLRTGSFIFFPSMTAGAGANSNVFNTSQAVSDVFYATDTALKMQSQWARHEFSVAAQTRSLWFAAQSGENRTDYGLDADLRLDLMRGSDIMIGGHYKVTHEARGTDVTGALEPGAPLEPTELSVHGANFHVRHSLNRVRLEVGGAYDLYDYLDTPRVEPAVPAVINNDDRDRTVTSAFGTLAFEALSEAAIFVRSRWDSQDYVEEIDDEGVNRDSTGIVLEGGLDFSVTQLLSGEISAGVATRDYLDPSLADPSSIAIDVGLKWFPTMLTTVTVDASRRIQQTSFETASGVLSTHGDVRIDHELLRNFILSGSVGFAQDEYQGFARVDDVMRGGVGGRLLINNNLHLDASWEVVNRASSELLFDYSSSQFQISLTGKM